MRVRSSVCKQEWELGNGPVYKFRSIWRDVISLRWCRCSCVPVASQHPPHWCKSPRRAKRWQVNNGSCGWFPTRDASLLSMECAHCLPMSAFYCHPSLYSYSALSNGNDDGISSAYGGWYTNAWNLLNSRHSSMQGVFLGSLHCLCCLSWPCLKSLQSHCATLYWNADKGTAWAFGTPQSILHQCHHPKESTDEYLICYWTCPWKLY